MWMWLSSRFCKKTRQVSRRKRMLVFCILPPTSPLSRHHVGEIGANFQHWVRKWSSTKGSKTSVKRVTFCWAVNLLSIWIQSLLPLEQKNKAVAVLLSVKSLIWTSIDSNWVLSCRYTKLWPHSLDLAYVVEGFDEFFQMYEVDRWKVKWKGFWVFFKHTVLGFTISIIKSYLTKAQFAS